MTHQHHLEDWQHDVANGDTTLGLDDWIKANINDEEEDGWDQPPLDTPSLDMSFHDHETDVG